MNYAQLEAENDHMLVQMMKLSMNYALDTTGKSASLEAAFWTFFGGISPILGSGREGNRLSSVALALKHTEGCKEKKRQSVSMRNNRKRRGMIGRAWAVTLRTWPSCVVARSTRWQVRGRTDE